jgi:DNA modification methylase
MKGRASFAPMAMPAHPSASADPGGSNQAPSRRIPIVRVGDAFTLFGDVQRESVDLMLTSPPYWGLRTYGHSHRASVLDEWAKLEPEPTRPPPWLWYRDHGGVLGMEPYPEWYVAHVVEILTHGRDRLKQSGSLWLNLGDTYFARWSSIRPDGRQGLGTTDRIRRKTPSGGIRQDKQLLMLPARIAIAMQEAGWILRNDLIWSKPFVAPRPEKDRLRLSHEHFFHFVKRSTHGRPAYYYDLASAEPNTLDVVSCAARPGSNDHSATFPLDLILPRIRTSSPQAGFVLDPFCGTGRTLVAAIAYGRLAQGFELSPAYARAARDNVRKARLAQTAIAGPT